MIWIDAPEDSKYRFGYKECESQKSMIYLESFFKKDKNIVIRFDEKPWKQDRYKRYLAYIYTDKPKVKTQTLINEHMIKSWNAYLYDNNFRLNWLFKKWLSKAKSLKIWVWSDANKLCARKDTKEEKEKLEKLG